MSGFLGNIIKPCVLIVARHYLREMSILLQRHHVTVTFGQTLSTKIQVVFLLLLLLLLNVFCCAP